MIAQALLQKWRMLFLKGRTESRREYIQILVKESALQCNHRDRQTDNTF